AGSALALSRHRTDDVTAYERAATAAVPRAVAPAVATRCRPVALPCASSVRDTRASMKRVGSPASSRELVRCCRFDATRAALRATKIACMGIAVAIAQPARAQPDTASAAP